MTGPSTSRPKQPYWLTLAITFARAFALFATIVMIGAALQRLFQDTASIPPWGPAFALWGHVTSGLWAAVGLAVAAVLRRVIRDRRRQPLRR